jgi:hypothetical protein
MRMKLKRHCCTEMKDEINVYSVKILVVFKLFRYESLVGKFLDYNHNFEIER